MIAIASTSCASGRRADAGFSLVELAIAVFVMALVIGGFLVPITSQVESRKIVETQRILDQAREALLAYVAANGYFPCPSSAATNGQEAVPNHTTGSCDASVTGTGGIYVGFLPAVTLGLSPLDSNGFLLDAWGTSVNSPNRIRYAVANASTSGALCPASPVQNPYTQNGGIRKATMGCVLSQTTLLYVCNSGTGITATGCGTATELSDNSIAVIWSLGANAGITAGGNAPNEDKNQDGNRVMVLAPYSRIAGSEFDDQLVWIGPPMLFNRMIAAGMLP